MRLLFLWVNCSENGFLKKKGFNISGEYYWKYDEEKRMLFSKKKAGYIKKFWNEDNDIIEDISVIVGTNGSGKSTLLSEIMRYGVIVPHELRGETNSEADVHRRIVEKKIVVYEEGGDIYYDHNLGYEIETYPVAVQKSMDVLKNCTKIYVSNSMNNPVKAALYQDENILDYALTDYTIADQAKSIMRKNQIPDYVYPSKEKGNARYYDDKDVRAERPYIERVEVLNYQITMGNNTYDELNSLIKLYFLQKSRYKKYMGKTYQYVKIKLKNQGDIFKREENEILINSKNNIWTQTTALKRKENNSLFDTLAIYFLYEYQNYYRDSSLVEIKEISVNQVEKIINALQDIASRDIDDSLQENMTTNEYFLNAANDLLLFYELIQKNRMVDSGWEKNHLAYYEALQVDLNNNLEFFDRLFLFFERGIPSIFMRYLTFEFEGMSSGEEAMMNLYSRIFWIYNGQSCKKESLILIDEIDLYMHPKWQRGLISYLVEDIPNLVGEGNKAQIIITTHSPIILSDVPRANTIFLENRNGKCIVDNNLSHRDTFGNNVHTLFLDSFFLDDEGTIGEFAEKKINNILKRLRSGEKIIDEDKTILKIINCIGDKLIKNKLLEMYEKNQGLQYQQKEKKTPAENTAIENTIVMLKSQVGELLRTIEQLEQMKND